MSFCSRRVQDHSCPWWLFFCWIDDCSSSPFSCVTSKTCGAMQLITTTPAPKFQPRRGASRVLSLLPLPPPYQSMDSFFFEPLQPAPRGFTCFSPLAACSFSPGLPRQGLACRICSSSCMQTCKPASSICGRLCSCSWIRPSRRTRQASSILDERRHAWIQTTVSGRDRRSTGRACAWERKGSGQSGSTSRLSAAFRNLACCGTEGVCPVLAC